MLLFSLHAFTVLQQSEELHDAAAVQRELRRKKVVTSYSGNIL